MNFKTLIGAGLAAGALTVSSIGGAGAAVSVVLVDDPSTPDLNEAGTGFVGKGDVQLAFGWNNSALQRNAAGVSFSLDTTDTYTATCEWTTGEGKNEKDHEVSHKKKTSVNASIAYEARKNGGFNTSITGFNLTGLKADSITTGGALPVVGDACPGNQGTDGTWTIVTLTSSSGGLFVTHGDISHSLPNTPVVAA